MFSSLKKRAYWFLFYSLSATLAFPVFSQNKKVLRNEDFSSEIKDYKRSSLKLLMVETPEKEKVAAIKTTFSSITIPEKFNDHTIGESTIKIAVEAKDHSDSITLKLKESQLAKKLVAKWFNRTQKGAFDLELVKKRGLYSANAFDIQIAKNTLRGNAMLEDAGEQLIGNTFVIVNDIKYTSKEEVVGKGLGIVRGVGTLLGANKAVSATNSLAAKGIDAVAKGYVIKNTSYLYRLVWDQEAAARFYGDLWMTKETHDIEKVKAFDEADTFTLEYIGRQDAWADVQSTKFTKKTDEELIARATIKAIDAAIAKLERKFEIFRTKTPLVSTEPIAAKIGTKEGLKKGDRFEVLEQQLLEDGSVEYKRVAEIAVDAKQIWDNSYLPEDTPETDIEYTVFKGNAKKLYPGMLIRFKRNLNVFK